MSLTERLYLTVAMDGCFNSAFLQLLHSVFIGQIMQLLELLIITFKVLILMVLVRLAQLNKM